MFLTDQCKTLLDYITLHCSSQAQLFFLLGNLCVGRTGRNKINERAAFFVTLYMALGLSYWQEIISVTKCLNSSQQELCPAELTDKAKLT